MQFDVYPTPGPARAFLPFIIDVQSDLLSSLDSRLIVPMLSIPAGKKGAPKLLTRLNPIIEFDGKSYALLANQMANISANRLRKPAGNLSTQRQAIVEAIDFLITGI
ncbi:MAG: CcdB family protein [Rhodocyclales bacterium]|nr:CcdB family protein [Rhodocyclales bacterium]